MHSLLCELAYLGQTCPFQPPALSRKVSIHNIPMSTIAENVPKCNLTDVSLGLMTLP